MGVVSCHAFSTPANDSESKCHSSCDSRCFMTFPFFAHRTQCDTQCEQRAGGWYGQLRPQDQARGHLPRAGGLDQGNALNMSMEHRCGYCIGFTSGGLNAENRFVVLGAVLFSFRRSTVCLFGLMNPCRCTSFVSLTQTTDFFYPLVDDPYIQVSMSR